MLSQAGRARSQRVKAEPRRIVAYPRAVTVGGGEAEDANFPA